MKCFLLVDDDSAIRGHLSAMISTLYAEPFTLLEADNADSALAVVCSRPVDVVFTDIKMPGLSGIELIQQLNRLNFGGKTVVISGFDDYSLVRQAMVLGAVDYLLKPIDAAELGRAIAKCVAEDAAGGQPHPRGQSGNTLELMFYQQYLMDRLLNGSGQELAHCCQELGAAPEDEVCFIRFESADPAERLWASNRIQWFEALRTAAAESLGCELGQLLQGEQADGWCLMARGQRTATEEALGLLLEAQAGRYSAAAENGHVDDIKQLYVACRRQMAEAFYDLDCGAPSQPAPSMEEMVPLALKGDADALCNALGRWMADMCARRAPHTEIRQLMADGYYRLVAADSRLLRVTGRYKFTPNDMLQAIQYAPTAAGLLQDVCRIIRLYLQQAGAGQSDDHVIRKARKYLEQHYMEPLSLAGVAEVMGLHPNYFSALFKQNVQKTYSQYLRQLRINEAKRLMGTTTLKLYEIAEAVGYHDNAHFYKAFKSVTGVSPVEYRRQIDS